MFEWKNYLKVAEDLIENSDSEESCRASISRAYYSAFNLCKEKYLVLSGEVAIPKEDSHKFVIDQYLNSKKVAKSIGNKLNTLKIKRVVSDYNAKDKVDILKAKDQIKLAKKIIEEDLHLVDETFFSK